MCHQIDQTTMGLWVSQRFSCLKIVLFEKTTPVLVSQFPVSDTLYIYIFVSDLYFLFLWFSLGVFQAAVTKMLFSLTNHLNKENNPTPHGVITWLLALTKIRSWFLHLPCHDSTKEYSESTSHESLAVRHRASMCDCFWRLLGVTSAQFEREKNKIPKRIAKTMQLFKLTQLKQNTLELHGMPDVWSYFQNICPEIVYGFTGNYNLKNPNLSFSHDISIGIIWHTVIL